MKKIALIVLVILLAASSGFGQFAKVGTAGLKFLDISVVTRAVGMGNVFAAFADDASTMFWNPAGMSNLTTGEAWAGMVSWPADIYLQAGAAALKVGDIGHFGVSFRFLDVGLMNETNVFNPNGTGGTFGVASWAAGISYSRSLTDRFALGLTFNVIQEQLADWTDETWAFDLGGYYDTGFQGLTLGFAVLNFGPAMRHDVDDDNDGQVDEDKLDGQDNDGVHVLADKQGKDNGEQQDVDNEILELIDKNQQRVDFRLGLQSVGAELFQALCRLLGGKPVFTCIESGQDIGPLLPIIFHTIPRKKKSSLTTPARIQSGDGYNHQSV